MGSPTWTRSGWCRPSSGARATSGAGPARSSGRPAPRTARTATTACSGSIITAPSSTTASASGTTPLYWLRQLRVVLGAQCRARAPLDRGLRKRRRRRRNVQLSAWRHTAVGAHRQHGHPLLGISCRAALHVVSPVPDHHEADDKGASEEGIASARGAYALRAPRPAALRPPSMGQSRRAEEGRATFLGTGRLMRFSWLGW